MSKAKPGEVLVDATTYARTSDDFQYEAGQPLQLKGMAAAVKNFVPGEKIQKRGHKGDIDEDYHGSSEHYATVRQESCQALANSLDSLLRRGGGTMVLAGERGSSKGEKSFYS